MPGSKLFAQKANKNYQKKFHQAAVAEMGEEELFKYKKQLIERFPKTGKQDAEEAAVAAMEGIKLSEDIDLDELEEDEEKEFEKVENHAAGDIQMGNT